MSESKQQEWFIAERARALAIVHLTRRDDLTVKPAGSEVGLEFLVHVKAERSLRPFGVFLRGALAAVMGSRLDDALRPAMRPLVRAGDFPYPVCLFYFTMADDGAYWSWVAEPDATDAGPRLVTHEEPHGRVLDRAALDEIVARVDGWYDAFFGRIVVKAS